MRATVEEIYVGRALDSKSKARPTYMTRIYPSKPALPFFFLLIFPAVLYGLG